MTTSAHGSASRAAQHPAFRKGARLGYAANGLVNVVIGWIALQLAVGAASGGGQDASASGALRTLADQPFGQVLLWLALAGFVLLGLFSLVAAFIGGETKDRAKDAAKGVVYLALAATTLGIVTGTGSGGDGTSGMTATLLQQPLGRILVGLVGLAIVAVGLYQAHKGWTKKFLQDLRERPPSWVVIAGRAGYVARGVAFVVLGGLLVSAATASDSAQEQGLDAALQTFRQAPYGQVLLGAVALGFIAYGVYSFARAKYARL
ncbi:membrane protein [Actinotalea ferrariae CF5-4]|uniref:Membrane protein n=1 Tax=Actinotalea ferrariae CF5-4 TaxID=948458 RepID=A0A021VU76_9CELL|nr:DUF1206 domain-containing protein [Actinotalea ferrariae]EYR62622.1 membrane protein [Actinotalea ferrariae CF5-4]